MLDTTCIAVYLLARKLVSNHRLKQWLPLINVTKKKYDQGIFPGITFIEKVRELYERKVISSALTSRLLQISLWKYDAERIFSAIKKKGIRAICFDNPEYPEGLRNIPDAPYVLFVRGAAIPTMHRCITIVGTRTPSEWGKRMARRVSSEVACLGNVSVSGFAKGVDTIVLQTSIKMKGLTIAVLPELDINKENIAGVVEISEYITNEIEVLPWQYVARNRIAAALSWCTILVEAPLRSGTLITAKLANEYDREVYSLLPDPASEGAYGGIAFTQAYRESQYIQSFYDVLWQRGSTKQINAYYRLLSLASGRKISIPESEARHIADVDLKRYIWAGVGKNLEQFEKTVVELLRLGMIYQRKGKIVINFSWIDRYG